MATIDLKIIPPWGGEQLDLGPYVGSVAAILGILVAAVILIRLAHVFVRGIVRALLNRENVEGTAHDLTAAEIKKRQDTIESLIINVVRFFVVVVAALMILETAFALDVGPAIAGLGIIGIAVGLGTQNLVRDYLNGALILIENQYSIGDVVQIAGVSGKVEDFTLRRTTLRDQDGAVHTVPNGLVAVASNLTREWASVNEDVQVIYGTNIAAGDRRGRYGRPRTRLRSGFRPPHPGSSARRTGFAAWRVRGHAQGPGHRPRLGAVGGERGVPQATPVRLRRQRHRDRAASANRRVGQSRSARRSPGRGRGRGRFDWG